MANIQERYKAMLDDPNVGEDVKAKLRSLMSVSSASSQKSIQKTNVRSSVNTSSGAQLFAKYEYGKACQRVTPGDPKSKIVPGGMGRITVVVHDIESAVIDPDFGKVVVDTDKEIDPRYKGVEQLDTQNQEYVPSGKKVLKMFVRGDLLDDNGEVIKKSRIADRPILRIVVVQEGDKLSCGTFSDSLPSDRDTGKDLRVGSFVLVRGVKTREYDGRTFWNCGDVIQSTADDTEMNAKVFKQMCADYPRNSVALVKIDEPPLSDEDRKNYGAPGARELSPELRAMLGYETLLCSWPSRAATPDGNDALMRELQKQQTIVWQPPLFSRSTNDYHTHRDADQQNPALDYTHVYYKQTCNFQRGATSLNVLHDIRIRSTQAILLSGIANAEKFGAIAPHHVPKMRFACFAKPNHDDTYKMDMNNEQLKDDTLSNVQFGLVWRTAKPTHIEHNLQQYVLDNGLPVTYDFVRTAFDESSDVKYRKLSKDEYNPYNEKPNSPFLNLSEHSFKLSDFEDGWQFRVLLNETLKASQQQKVQAIDDPVERAKKCTESLLNEQGDDDLEIGHYTNKTYVIFAVRDDFAEHISENRAHYDMSMTMDAIENLALAYDPAEAKKASDDRKRKYAEVASNAQQQGADGDEAAEGSEQKRAKADEDNAADKSESESGSD